MCREKKWECFLREVSNLIFFWFFGIVFFFIYRCSFIYTYKKEIGDSVRYGEYLSTVLMGFKFDCTAVAYFLLIPILSTLILSWFNKQELIRNIRKSFQSAFVIISALICIVTINYYKEFNDQFNNFVFLGLDDDKEAVFKTIIDSYNPVENSLLLIFISIIGIFLFRYFEKGSKIYNVLQKVQSRIPHLLFIIILLYFSFACLRGTLTHPPVMRKWAAVSIDPVFKQDNNQSV